MSKEKSDTKKDLLNKIFHEKHLAIFIALILVLAVNYVVFSFLLINRDQASAAVVLGNSTVGSNIYPDAGLKKIDEKLLEIPDYTVRDALVDNSRGYAYVVASPIAQLNVAPKIIRINLATNTREAAITLNEYGQNFNLNGGVIDEVNGYAYWGPEQGVGASGSYQNFYKVDIDPTRNFKVVQAISVPSGFSNTTSGFIDASGNYAYIAGTGGRISKIDINPVNVYQVVSTLNINLTDGSIFSAVYDPLTNFAYLGCRGPGALLQTSIAKIDLATFSPVATILVPEAFDPGISGDSPLFSGVIDPVNGFAYFGTWFRSPNERIIKIDLNAVTPEGFAVFGFIDLTAGMDYLGDAEIDLINQFAYFTYSNVGSPGRIVKINLNDLLAPAGFSHDSDFTFTVPNPGGSHVQKLIYYLPNRDIYAFAGGTPADTYAVQLEIDPVLSVTTNFLLRESGGPITGVNNDPTTNISYWSTVDSPAKIFKLDNSNFTLSEALTLQTGEGNIGIAVLDTVNKYGYFSTIQTGTGEIVKVDISNNDPLRPFSRLSVLSFPGIYFRSSVIDVPRQLAYFGFIGGGMQVRRLNMSGATPVQTGSVTDVWGNSTNSGVIDLANNLAYFANGSAPDFSRIWRFDINSPTFSQIGYLDFTSATPLIHFIDDLNYKVYASSSTTTPIITQIDVTPGQPMQVVDSLSLAVDEINIRSGMFDQVNDIGYFGAYTTSKLIKIKLNGNTGSGLEYLGRYSAPGADNNLTVGFIDTATSTILMGLGTTPTGKIIKLSYSHKNYVFGTKMTVPDPISQIDYFQFYSFEASGNIRLALYYDNPLGNIEKIWESNVIPNNVTADWLTIPVNNGTPTSIPGLPLPAGDYWLAWQTDSTADIGSYLPGSTGDGFYLPQSFGSFPANPDLSAGFTVNDQAWSITANTYEAGRSAGGLGMPLAPVNLTCEPIGPDKINWNFEDVASDETGFRLYQPADIGQEPVLIQETNGEIVRDLQNFEEYRLLPNVEYTRFVRTFNGAGESLDSNIDSCYTLASTPLKPIITAVKENSIILRLNPNDGNPDYTEYTIYENNLGKYVQADGTFGAEPVWQTYQEWGALDGIEIIGSNGQLMQFKVQFNISLDTGTTYDFSVKARNVPNTETDFSDSASATPGEEVPAEIPVPPAVSPTPTTSPTPPAASPLPGPTPVSAPPAVTSPVNEVSPEISTTPTEEMSTAEQEAAARQAAEERAAAERDRLAQEAARVAQGQTIGQQIWQSFLDLPLIKYLRDVFFDNLHVEQFSQNVLTPILLTLAILNTIPSALILTSHLLLYLHLLFIEPLLYLFKKRREKWGVVYDSLSKRPVDLAIVRLFRQKDRQVVQTRVTDINGRYLIIAKEPGNYYLEVIKPGYQSPSKYLKDDKLDTQYLDIYHGEVIKLTTKQATVSVNIPIDPLAKKSLTIVVAVRAYLIKNLRLLISYLGIILATLTVLIVPTIMTIGALLLHIMLYLIFRRLIVPPKPKNWGKVYDQKTNEPLHYAVVRIFETRFNKMLETQVTDRKGRYAFLVGKNTYQLLSEKLGYERKEVKPVDLVKKDEIVGLDIGLAKSTKIEK